MRVLCFDLFFFELAVRSPPPPNSGEGAIGGVSGGIVDRVRFGVEGFDDLFAGDVVIEDLGDVGVVADHDQDGGHFVLAGRGALDVLEALLPLTGEGLVLPFLIRQADYRRANSRCAGRRSLSVNPLGYLYAN